MRSFFIVLTVLLSMSATHAEQLGMTQGADMRVQVFNYDPSDVYVINAQIGYATLVQLEKGEEIPDDYGALGMGDAQSWSLAVRGNNVLFKPIAEMPNTNILLVTNKRTYAFELRTHGIPTYIARFNYPADDAPPKDAPPPLPQYLQVVATDSQGTELLMDADINTSYSYRGNADIKPTSVWDDGRFTYLRYNHAGDLPTVYRVMPDGSEMLVNTHTDGDTLVLHEVSSRYRVRFGKVVGEIGNQHQKQPKFNTLGTGDKRFVRIGH